MVLTVHHDDGTITPYAIEKELFEDATLKNRVCSIGSSSKTQNALHIFKAYFSQAKAVLYDQSNHILQKRLETLNVPCITNTSPHRTIFDEQTFNFIYFTSGSTGHSTAALKNMKNIKSEIDALSKQLKKYRIRKVIVTVPFIHIYGSLTGLFYPYFNDIDIVLKEHFLPNDLLQMIEPHSLVVTTPLYIKALNQLASTKDLSQSLFLSSTAPLQAHEAKTFKEKFSCDIMQLFGSTETGGIAYKFNDDTLWTPLESVTIETNENHELKVASPFISDVLFETQFVSTNNELQTFDYIERHDKQFKLIGRSSQILKIAGKRYSTIQIEHILEEQEGIHKALVYVKSDLDSLRGEVLDITLEADYPFTQKQIKHILQKSLSNLKFSMHLNFVNKIPTSSVGKKLRITL